MINEPTVLAARIDEDGDLHQIYQLPTRVAWKFKYFSEDLSLFWQETHLVGKVRICLCISDHYTGPVVVVIPYNEKGQEEPVSAVTFQGAYSFLAALNRLGFPPALPSN